MLTRFVQNFTQVGPVVFVRFNDKKTDIQTPSYSYYNSKDNFVAIVLLEDLRGNNIIFYKAVKITYFLVGCSRPYICYSRCNI